MVPVLLKKFRQLDLQHISHKLFIYLYANRSYRRNFGCRENLFHPLINWVNIINDRFCHCIRCFHYLFLLIICNAHHQLIIWIHIISIVVSIHRFLFNMFYLNQFTTHTLSTLYFASSCIFLYKVLLVYLRTIFIILALCFWNVYLLIIFSYSSSMFWESWLWPCASRGLYQIFRMPESTRYWKILPKLF